MKKQIIAAFFWVGTSLFVMTLSYRLDLGSFRDPGPGLMPFLLGVLLLPFSFYRLVRSVLKKDPEDKMMVRQGKINFARLCLILVSLFAYILLLERIGFLIATFLLLSLLFRSMGSKKLIYAMGAAGLTVLVTYALFTFLGVRFPPGVLRFIGF